MECRALKTIVYTLVIATVISCQKNIDPMETSGKLGAISERGNHGGNREVALKLIAENLVSPIGVVPSPDETRRLFVIDQIGKIWIVDRHGNTLPVPFMDLTGRMVTLRTGFDERGLLGLAFHPNYKRNGRFFVYYNAPPRAGGPTPTTRWDNLSRISEFRVSSNPNLADMTSERPLLELDDPQFNHNGGTLAFGPKDGYLYISIGDGGGANDVGPGHVEDWYAANAGGNGQDVEANLFGNILRIDVNSGMPYGIPGDNPFVGRAGRDEIYAYGLRNPYRMAFDPEGSNQLIAGDAGQLLYEEIDVIRKGDNYGWNVKEGTSCFNAASPLTPFTSCPNVDPMGNPLRDPVVQLLNFRNTAPGRKATTVIGGNVYRGNELHDLRGKYIFGTFSQNPGIPDAELFFADMSGNMWPFAELIVQGHPDDLDMYLKGFGQDLQGEVYITTSLIAGPNGTTGKVFRLVKGKHNHGNDGDE